MPRIERLQHEIEGGFWEEHYPKLQRYCQFLAQNSWDGDDIAQETFLKALKYPNPTSSLLNKIAYHHWIDIHRKRKIESLDLEETTQTQVDQISFEKIVESIELLLKKFTPKQAVIFLLKEAFQYQSKEIAEMLETSETAVKAILHRAKQRLEKDISVETFWDDHERERLGELFFEALKNQDPSILIVSLPTISSIQVVPKMFTPSSTLCMAA